MEEKTKLKILISILIIGSIIMFFGTSFVDAKMKTYDSEKQEVLIESSFLGIPTGDIAKIKLNTALNYEVPRGYQKVAEFEVISYKDYENALEQIEFYNIKENMKKIDRIFDYKVKSYELIDINDYSEVCSTNKNFTITCESVISGTHKEQKEKWLPLGKLDFKEGEVLTIGIFTEVLKGDRIEWIPTYYGVKIDEWASWSESLYTGLIAYYTNDYSSGNLIDAHNGVYNLTKQNNPIYGLDGIVNDAIKIGQYSGFFSGDIAGVNQDTNTLIVWFKKSEAGSGIAFIGNGNPAASQAGMRMAYDNTNLYCTINDAAYGPGVTTAWVSDTNWHQLICIYNITTIHQYFDGVFKGNSTWDGRSLKEIGNGMNIGADASGFIWSGNYTFDEISIHNRSLTISEITELYNAGYGCTYGSCIELGVEIDLNSPIDNYNTSNTNIEFNISAVTFFPHILVQNVSLYIDDVLNETNTSNYNGTYIFNKILSEGTHTWKIISFSNQSAETISLTRTFTIDLTTPIITFTYPLNTTYYNNWANTTQLNVTFNWTSYDLNLNSCWYSKNGGTNISLVCNSNLTTNATYGTPINILACANDSVNSIGCSSRTATFKYKIFEINQSYNNPVLESILQDYYANIYLDSSLSINSAYFTYDGVNYSASYSNIGNYTRLEKTSFYTPSVSSNTNKSISWWVLLNDSSVIPLTTRLQQVNNLIYSSICNSTYPYYVFNFTLKDEKTQININGTIETDIRIQTANGTITLFNWTTSLYNTSLYLCANNPMPAGGGYSVNGTIKYWASNENYSAMVEYYNFLNFSYNINTAYQNITLYDLNTTEGTEFQLTFKDGSYRTREDILIYVYRQYIPEGIFKVVELPKTDSNGQTIVHLVRNDVVYNLIAVDSQGNVLGVLNNVLAFCEDYTIGDCKINFQGTTEETELEDYLGNLGLSYTLDFDETTNTINFVFSSTTAESKDIRLEVISAALVTNRTICNQSLDAIAGTISCDVSSIINSSSSIIVNIYLDDVQIIQEFLDLFNSTWNVKGIIFVGFLFILLIGIFFIESKEGMIIGIVLGFIVLIALGVVQGKIIGFTSGIIWLIIVAIILLIKLNKDNKT